MFRKMEYEIKKRVGMLSLKRVKTLKKIICFLK